MINIEFIKLYFITIRESAKEASCVVKVSNSAQNIRFGPRYPITTLGIRFDVAHIHCSTRVLYASSAFVMRNAMLKVTIFIATQELTKNEYDTLIALVSNEKKNRIKRLNFYRDKQNSLIGDILVRLETCCITGYQNRQLAFSTTKYVKPYLANNPRIQFSISHAGYYIAVVVSDGPVGIDIELIRPIDLWIANRLFASDEISYVLASKGNTQYQRFFEIWTKKESRIKWEGKGFSKPFPSINVFDPPEVIKLNYYDVFQNDDVMCHVCSANDESIRGRRHKRSAHKSIYKTIWRPSK